MSTSVVLSGGSVKGMYQVGALRALHELGELEDVDLMVGSSVGAINAAAMAYCGIDALEDIWFSLERRSDLFKPAWWRLKGLYSLKPTLELVDHYVRGEPVCEAVAVAVNIETFEKRFVSNEEVSLKEFKKFVAASSTIPFFMEPTHGHWFDGGIKDHTPIPWAAEKHDKVIAITTKPIVHQIAEGWSPSWPKILSYGMRTVDDAMQHEIFLDDVEGCEKATVLIAPDKWLEIDTFDVDPDKFKKLYLQGYNDVKRLYDTQE